MALTKAQLVDMNSNELILDLDADTSLHSDTDDQIDIKIGGADDFRFTANTFTALSGSTIAAQALTATTFAVSNDGTIGSTGDADSIAISSAGVVTFSQRDVHSSGITVANDGQIGSAGDADAMAISSSGVVTFTQSPVFPDGSLAGADIDIDGTTDIGAAIADADEFLIDDGGGGTNRKTDASRIKTYIADVTLTTAAQTNITSLGTLSALTVDDVAIDGKVITMTGSSSDTAVITAGTNGTLSIVTTDAAAAAANMTITADGTIGINSTGDMTLDSSTDIILDADGGDLLFKDGGTEILRISNTSSDAVIQNKVDTKDIIFKQFDGTTTLTLDDDTTVKVATDLTVGDDASLVSDAAVLNFGADSEIKLTHVADTGLLLTDSGGTPTLQFHDANESISSDGGHLIFTSNGVAFDFPSADGSSGQFLKTNGSGVLSFDTVSSAADDLSAGDAAVNITTSSGNITIDAAANDTDIIFKGTDNSSDITMLTLDGSDAGHATFNNAITSGAVITSGAGLVIADAGNIGSASDTDAIAIASNGVVTFSQAPVFPDGSVAVADLDIDGATDIGAAIVDADLFIIDDGAGGTNRKVAASRIKTYAGGLTGVSTGSGNVTIDDGNLILASGHGVDFSATADLSAGDATMTAELFDDYEEGTWTSTVSSNSGSITVNTSNDECTYVKIGRHVFLNGSIGISSVSSPSGRLTINNKPFASTGGEGGHRGVGTVCFHNPASDEGSGIIAMIFEDYDPIRLHNSSSGGEINANKIQASSEIRFMVNYHAG